MKVAGYCRISVDIEQDRDNTSIENQKSIIEDYVQKYFPDSELNFFVDRDKSGYTFEQRDEYQKMRPLLLSGEYQILLVKDFSRFARRNSRGLVELEDLRDAGVRIISIGDSIDFPTYDDWLQIQIRFLMNEMPVTDASKKVKAVIKRRQEEGKWLCALPYGYAFDNAKQQKFHVVPDEAEVVREVFHLYTNEGWGYKKIANYLTDKGIPTPRMKEKERIEARGDVYKRKNKTTWSIISIQGILENDFYIGTLRQKKYVRNKINGSQVKIGEDEHIVFENHHEPIIDITMWLRTQEQKKQRTTSNYRGVKKYPNVYSGLIICGDCGEPMFSMSRSDLRPAYICGSYHRRGTKACSSHHIRTELLDAVIKEYITLIRDNSEMILEELEETIKKESTEVKESDNTLSYLETLMDNAKQELKTLKNRKIKEIIKYEAEGRSETAISILEETYQEMEDDLILRMSGLQSQIENTADKRNDIIRINRLARTVIDVFNDIINKETLDKVDLNLIVDKIMVYDDNRVGIKLKADIDSLLKIQSEKHINFNCDSKVIEKNKELLMQSISIDSSGIVANVRVKASRRPEQLFTVNVINKGDPMEIFTSREGEILLKKYSPVGELGEFAATLAESVSQTVGELVCVTDRDYVIAAAGTGKKEFEGKILDTQLQTAIDNRCNQVVTEDKKKFIKITQDDEKEYMRQAVATILSHGDCIGAVVILSKDNTRNQDDVLLQLAKTVASFLGKHMEQ